MQNVIRISKAIPWATFAKLSFKALCLVGFVMAAIILFVVRFFATERKKEDEDDFWSPLGPDARRRRPDLHGSNGK